MKKNALKRKQILGIILGNICITLPYALLTVPNKIINGGITSTSLILTSWIDIPITFVVDILMILFLFIAYIGIGKEFFYKTLFSNLCYMFFFHLFQLIPHNIDFNLIIMVIIAGIIVGTGYFFCISSGASNGGFDIISIYLHEKDNRYDVAITMRYISWFIILIGFFIFGLKSVVLGFLFSFIETETLKILIKLDEKDVKKRDKI